jgi:hypothetical protein
MLTEFLLQRRNSKGNIIEVCKQGKNNHSSNTSNLNTTHCNGSQFTFRYCKLALMPHSLCPLAMISKIFDKINKAYYACLESEANSSHVSFHVHVFCNRSPCLCINVFITDKCICIFSFYLNHLQHVSMKYSFEKKNTSRGTLLFFIVRAKQTRFSSEQVKVSYHI